MKARPDLSATYYLHRFPRVRAIKVEDYEATIRWAEDVLGVEKGRVYIQAWDDHPEWEPTLYAEGPGDERWANFVHVTKKWWLLYDGRYFAKMKQADFHRLYRPEPPPPAMPEFPYRGLPLLRAAAELLINGQYEHESRTLNA